MGNTVVAEYDYYTLDQARQIISEEHHHAWLCRQKEFRRIKEAQKRRREYYCRQKMLGLLIAVINLMLLAVTREGICLGGVALGVYAIFTKKMVLINEYWWEQRENEDEQ